MNVLDNKQLKQILLIVLAFFAVGSSSVLAQAKTRHYSTKKIQATQQLQPRIMEDNMPSASNSRSTTSSATASTATTTNNTTSKATKLESVANQYLGTAYVYGGSTPSGFDCSGFTQYTYAQALNKTLPRTAQAQYDLNNHISETQAKKGDLVFFGSSISSISHVGLYLGNGKMIDSQNRGVVVEAVHAPWWNLVGFARVK